MWDNLSMSYTSGTNRMSGFSNSASGFQDLLTLGYDANGNVTQYENADFSIYQTMGYDAYDRMVSVDEGMGTTVTQYRYNSDGWRYYRKRGSLNPVYSIRDGSISLAEYTGTTGGVTWNIVLPDGTPIGRKPFSSGKSFYYRDHLGSTRTVVYENGTIQQVLDYYPFGLEMSGRGMVSGSPVLQRFTGYERTSESMLDYAGARWYNPRLGRFWSVDPMAGEFPAWSPYNYALNDPLVYIDPSGEIPLGIIRRIGKFGLKFAKTRSVDAAMEAVTGGIREDFGTVIDSEAAFSDRALAAGSLALELFSPVTGRDVKSAGNAIGFGKSADNVSDAAKGGGKIAVQFGKTEKQI